MPLSPEDRQAIRDAFHAGQLKAEAAHHSGLVGFHPVSDVMRHEVPHKKAFKVEVEGGRTVTATEDHSLFWYEGGWFGEVLTGQLKKGMTLAVVVDGKAVRAPAGAAAGAPKQIESWSPEKIKEFEAIVASAVGIDRKRGDTLEIKNMEFSREDFDEAERMIAESERKSYIQNMITYAVIGLIIVLFFLLVVRPFIKWITENTIDSVDSFLPQTIEELEKMQRNASLPGMEDTIPVLPEKLDPDKVEGEMIKEKIITLVDSNPHKAALILKEWLHGAADKKLPAAPPAGGDKGKSA